METKHLLIVLLLFSFISTNAQTWKAKKTAPLSTFGASGFSLNNKIYVGGGNSSNTWWEYDPQNDSWTQKSNLPGSNSTRSHFIAFTINGKGYITLGSDIGFLKDMWEYNVGNDSWTKMPDFPGAARYEAICFVLNNKAYIGTGGGISGTGIYSDMWEFDPVANTWTQKSDAPVAATGAAYFTANGKGYYSSGWTNNGSSSFTCEYDPVTDIWKTVAACPGPPNNNGCGFSVGSYGYVGLGLTQTVFRKYNPISNTWGAAPVFPGAGRLDPTAIVLGTKAYVGLGQDGTTFSDWYEFNDPTAEIGAVNLTKTGTFCYPNPTTDKLFINVANDLEGYNYIVCNIVGQLQKYGKIARKNCIDVGVLPVGQYILTIDGGNNVLQTLIEIKR